MTTGLIISVVDDDESVRISTEGLLRSLGYAVRGFASAEAFLESDVAAGCACVVSDVQMPGMSGVDLKTALSARGLATPVILMTAFPNDATRQKAAAAGVACFLPKPYQAQALIDCIETALAA
ncbi:response regulator [Caulobacter segnis]|uniref:response regulator transcription factor n=1 Tax=Caulobacter segnis TaxID=88688 RepID=UPI00240F8705|nr:response regulator [Caulobacter segnis]MDG2523588.1 response regulator [Caulobacter segnis]